MLEHLGFVLKPLVKSSERKIFPAYLDAVEVQDEMQVSEPALLSRCLDESEGAFMPALDFPLEKTGRQEYWGVVDVNGTSYRFRADFDLLKQRDNNRSCLVTGYEKHVDLAPFVAWAAEHSGFQQTLERTVIELGKVYEEVYFPQLDRTYSRLQLVNQHNT